MTLTSLSHQQPSNIKLTKLLPFSFFFFFFFLPSSQFYHSISSSKTQHFSINIFCFLFFNFNFFKNNFIAIFFHLLFQTFLWSSAGCTACVSKPIHLRSTIQNFSLNFFIFDPKETFPPLLNHSSFLFSWLLSKNFPTHFPQKTQENFIIV